MKKVFVVDDEKMITDIVERFLQKSGYDVTVANSLEEGLSNYTTEYDIAILDIMLGNEDSFPLLEKVKQAKPETIVFMFSGYDTEEYISKAKKLGADGFIPKPFKIEFLSDMLLKKIAMADKKKSK